MIETIILLVAMTVVVTGLAVWDLWGSISIMRSQKAFSDSYTSTLNIGSYEDDLSRQKADVKRSALMVLAGLVWPLAVVGIAIYFIIDLIKGVREAWK